MGEVLCFLFQEARHVHDEDFSGREAWDFLSPEARYNGHSWAAAQHFLLEEVEHDGPFSVVQMKA